MKYIGPDFYNITNLLTEEELAIQKTAHDFVRNEFTPVIQKHFRDGTFPTTIIPRLGEIGVFGSTFPEEFGGAGVEFEDACVNLHNELDVKDIDIEEEEPVSFFDFKGFNR